MDLLQSISTAGAVLLLLAAVLWLLRKKGLAQIALPGTVRLADRRLQVLERVALTPQHALCLVRVEARTVLIATGPQSCALLQTEAGQ